MGIASRKESIESRNKRIRQAELVVPDLKHGYHGGGFSILNEEQTSESREWECSMLSVPELSILDSKAADYRIENT